MELIRIEWLKIKKYPAFWWMLGIVALTYPGINLMFYNIFLNITTRKDMTGAIAKSLLGNPFAFPEVWHSVAYFSSWFVMVPAILVIMIITNEYQYRTHRQNIIDGWSRNEFMVSKLMDVVIITIVATIAYLLTAGIFGLVVKDENTTSSWTEQIKYIPLFMLQTFAQLTLAFLLGFLVKKAFIALGLFLFWFLVVENMLRGLFHWLKLSEDLYHYLPLGISNRLIPFPQAIGKLDADGYAKALAQINPHIAYTVVLTAAIWWLCFSVYKKRDL